MTDIKHRAASLELWNSRATCLDLVRRFLDPNTSNCRWPSFPAVSSFGDCSHVCRTCEKRKTSTAQAHDTFGHLVLLDYTPNIRSGRFYV